MPEFEYSDLLPLGPDETPYRLLSTEGVSTVEAAGRTFLRETSSIGSLLCQDAFARVVVGFVVTGPGSGLSEVLVWGCEPAALD